MTTTVASKPDPYDKTTYWNERFHKGEDLKRQFEWFLTWEQLEPLIWPLITKRARRTTGDDEPVVIVDVGCGTSQLINQIAMKWKQHKHQMTRAVELHGLDFSSVAIEVMSRRGSPLPAVSFRVADTTKDLKTLFKPNSVDMFIDKSLTDTILHDTRGGERKVAEMLKQVSRALVPGGAWVCVTQLNVEDEEGMRFFTETIASSFLAGGDDERFDFTAHCAPHELDVEDKEAAPPPTVLIGIKRKPHPMIASLRKRARSVASGAEERVTLRRLTYDS